MSKFETVRKTIKRNKRRIHIMYVIIFLLVLLVGKLYFQEYKSNTRTEITSEYTSQLEEIREIYVNDINKLETLNVEYQTYLDSLPFGNPIDGDIDIVSEFGWRSDPFTSFRSFHQGIDLDLPYNDPVLASGTGIIIFAGWQEGYGNCVIIEHALGYESLYAHLETITVAVDDKIEIADLIGTAGCTGRSTGVHLHYEIHQNGTRIDPFKYLQYFSNRSGM